MARTKTEDGVAFPAEAYAYVPDPDQPSTWKLRLWETPQSKETARQVGMAIAALSTGGFRGNRVEIPRADLAAVKARIRAAWKKTHPEASEDELPAVLREGAGRQDAGQDGTQRLLEFTTSRGLNLHVDGQKAVISGVKVLGTESANGRTYRPEALAAAVKLYEAKPVNIDHLDGGRRSYRDRIGRLMNVRVGPDGIYADLAVNPKHPLAEQLLWDAEHAPENVGLSHDARGRTVVRDGRVIVEAIESVRSVDLVAEPATTRGLYEGVDDQDASSAVADPADQADDADDTPVEDPDRLPDDAFALVLPGGVKIRDRTFPLSKRWFPIHTPDAVKRSLQRIATNQRLSPQHRAIALERAKAAAQRFGIDPHFIVKEGRMAVDLSQLTLAELKEARPDLVAELQAAGEVEKQLVALKEEHDKVQAELARYQRREKLQKELAEAKLALEEIPNSLQEVLVEADDHRRKALIADLQKLHVSAPKPQSVRPENWQPAGSFEDRVRAWIA